MCATSRFLRFAIFVNTLRGHASASAFARITMFPYAAAANANEKRIEWSLFQDLHADPSSLSSRAHFD